MNDVDRALRDLERATTPKKRGSAGKVVGLILVLTAIVVASVAYAVFFYWTMIDAAVLAEGGLETRLVVIMVIAAVMSVWQVAKVVYSKK